MSIDISFSKSSGSAAPKTTFTCGAADFTTFWMPPSTAIIAAVGELDAANATEFAQYAWRAGRVTRLLLDLTGVEFFGTAGHSALLAFNEHCAAEGVEWVMVPSRAVSRVLDICDADSVLAVKPTVEAALSALSGDSPPLLQLVPESR
ncbi:MULTISPECIES: STAS domain-containing protein [unclassified Mycobacterium]|uniref:STAS domain-containing protein n=1 Tax=unclassified Mycobacterium TaxID=2642494 RepID=UPI0029C7D118|nr:MULTISPECIES: STAS domain-containing protein [unclassified Mycobacterium]